MNRRTLLTTLAFPAVSSSSLAQTLGSVYDPQIAALTVEGRFPLTAFLTDYPDLLGLPPEVSGAINAGALELRARLEYNRGARLLRIYQMVVPANTPYPLPATPDISAPFVGGVFDLSIEKTQWFEYRNPNTRTVRRTVNFVGRRLGLYKGTVPLEDEPGMVQLGFDRDDPTKIRLFSFGFPGVMVAAATTPVGRIEMEPGRPPQ
jgi:hypothetical protein